MVQDQDGKFRCGAGFQIDQQDIALARFIAQAQYDFQQYFFYELAQAQHDKHAKNTGKRQLSRNEQNFRRLPDISDISDVMRVYGYDNKNSAYSTVKRLQDSGKIIRIRTGKDKGKYRKL